MVVTPLVATVVDCDCPLAYLVRLAGTWAKVPDTDKSSLRRPSLGNTQLVRQALLITYTVVLTLGNASLTLY